MVDDRLLWAVSGLLTVVMAAAVVLPARPLVWIFPLWGFVVALAMLAGVLTGAVAALRGWPAGGESV